MSVPGVLSVPTDRNVTVSSQKVLWLYLENCLQANINLNVYLFLVVGCSVLKFVQTFKLNTVRYVAVCSPDFAVLNGRVRGLSGKYPAILNISRTGRVALM